MKLYGLDVDGYNTHYIEFDDIEKIIKLEDGVYFVQYVSGVGYVYFKEEEWAFAWNHLPFEFNLKNVQKWLEDPCMNVGDIYLEFISKITDRRVCLAPHFTPYIANRKNTIISLVNKDTKLEIKRVHKPYAKKGILGIYIPERYVGGFRKDLFTSDMFWKVAERGATIIPVSVYDPDYFVRVKVVFYKLITFDKTYILPDEGELEFIEFEAKKTFQYKDKVYKIVSDQYFTRVEMVSTVDL